MRTRIRWGVMFLIGKGLAVAQVPAAAAAQVPAAAVAQVPVVAAVQAPAVGVPLTGRAAVGAAMDAVVNELAIVGDSSFDGTIRVLCP